MKIKKQLPQSRRLIINSDFWRSLLLFVIAVPIIEPEGISSIWPQVGYLVWGAYTRYFSSSVLILLFIYQIVRTRKIDLSIFFALAFALIAACISIKEAHTLDGWLTRYLSIISAAFLIALYLQDLPRLINVVSIYLETLIVINFILVVLYPQGMYEGAYLRYNWLLGYKSSIQYYMIPALALAWVKAEYSKKKVSLFCFFAICVAEAILSRNVMLTTGILALATSYVFGLERKTKFLNGVTYFSFSTFIIVIVVVLTKNSKLPIISFLLVLLGKEGTMSTRIGLWNKALELIGKHPLFGYGVFSSKQFNTMFGTSVGHCHNCILQLLLDGGIVLLVVYFILLIYVCHRLMVCKNERTSQILGICLFVLLSMSAVEIFMRNVGTGTWMVLLLCGLSNRMNTQLIQKYTKD